LSAASKALNDSSLFPDEMPKKAESYTDVMDDFEKKIMPGILHWNHPNFFAYFGAGNAYPSVLGDMLSSGIAAIGFSWVSLSVLRISWVLSDCLGSTGVLSRSART
jgi:glutamate/tyrosine decarboxylase-like PLP-dependent enzyme